MIGTTVVIFSTTPRWALRCWLPSFGHELCMDISGNWEIDGVDTIAGVCAALERYPWIDPQRVMGLGASDGGFTSNWLNGNAPKDMFQALVCHCGTFDLRSSYYATEGE